jgi:hypothetical protein
MSANYFGHQNHHSRQGPCHNCGWTQTLRKVSSDQAALIRRNARGGPRFGLRWLCEECVLDLTSADQLETVPSHAGAHRLLTPAQARHRSVA